MSTPTSDADGVEDSPAQDPPPWSIPIREPAVPVRTRRSQHRLGSAILVLAVVAATALLGAELLDGGGGATTSGERGEPTADGDGAAGIDGEALRTDAASATSTTSAPATTTTEAAPATEAAPVTRTAPATTAAPATTVAPTTTEAPAPSGTGSVPALSTSFRGWVAQLTSVPYSAGTDHLESSWQMARSAAPGAVAARSDDWSALQDGYWVLLDPGPFASADEVRAFCASAGLDGDECLARELRG